MAKLKLTPSQEAIRKNLEDDTGGYNNGHVWYMVAGLPTKERVGELLEFLDSKEKTGEYCFCELSIEGKRGSYAVSVHSHEKYLSELINELSEAFPETVVYWNDCWDYEGILVVMKNGEDIEPEEVCEVRLKEDQIAYGDEEAEEPYYECTAEVTDDATGAKFEMGGGYISPDQRDAILDLCSIRRQIRRKKLKEEKTA